ncbi:MAG: hypothetical protein EOO41_03255 [Methanobacteriota archaeon]|nr:MAG: hypothetical protein EOO41_03255 [Euryarchaeota archaeon]
MGRGFPQFVCGRRAVLVCKPLRYVPRLHSVFPIAFARTAGAPAPTRPHVDAYAIAEPRECCAMDYMVHTVDGAAALLQSTKAFPSKVLIKAPAAAHFPNLARRLYRCLSHMWVHHHDMFMEYERHTLVALRFTNLCRAYSLVSADQLLIDDTDLEVAAAAARQ